MKIRSDFVTNSSSSSFIVAFKGKSDYAKRIKELDSYGEEIKNQVVGDIDKGMRNLEGVLEFYATVLEWEVYYDLVYGSNSGGVPASYESEGYYDGDEFAKIRQQEVKRRVDALKAVLPKRGIYSVLSYSDDCEFASKLEWEVMPSMSFTAKRINQH